MVFSSLAIGTGVHDVVLVGARALVTQPFRKGGVQSFSRDIHAQVSPFIAQGLKSDQVRVVLRRDDRHPGSARIFPVGAMLAQPGTVLPFGGLLHRGLVSRLALRAEVLPRKPARFSIIGSYF